MFEEGKNIRFIRFLRRIRLIRGSIRLRSVMISDL